MFHLFKYSTNHYVYVEGESEHIARNLLYRYYSVQYIYYYLGVFNSIDDIQDMIDADSFLDGYHYDTYKKFVIS